VGRAHNRTDKHAAGAQRRATVAATIVLDPPDPQTRSLWQSGLTLMAQLDGDWTLVGGLMVQLQAARHGVESTRPTEDVDVLGNSRSRPSTTERIAERLVSLGFELAEIDRRSESRENRLSLQARGRNRRCPRT
jgi:hypothetical protein